MMENKNFTLEWYRYFFAFFICAVHFKEYAGHPYPFGGAYLAVEFFLLTSGFFLMKTIKEYDGRVDAETALISFLKKRIVRLYPQYIVSWLILAAYCVFIRHSVTIKDLLVNYVDEIFCLQMLGAGKHLNAALWYISALLMVSAVIFYLGVKFQKGFTHILAPAVVLLVYSFFYQTNGSLAGIAWANLLIVRNGFWRALAGICLGCIVYNIYIYTERRQKKCSQKPKIRILQIVYECGTLVLLSVMFYRAGCTVKDFTLVGMMALLLLSIMLEDSYLSCFLRRIKIEGSYSYAIYCNHWVLLYFIHDFFPGYSFYPMLGVYLFLVVILSILTTKIVRGGHVWMRRRGV